MAYEDMWPIVLVLDDEKNIRKSIEWALENEGITALTAHEPAQALRLLEQYPVDLMILDIRLGEIDGITFFRKIRSEGFVLPVIFISGHASLAEAAGAVKIGGFDFIEKPFNSEKLVTMVNDCLEQQSVKKQLSILKLNADDLVGECRQIQAVKARVLTVATSTASILITGESGTGKKLLATMIHRLSQRSRQAFITVNCSALPDKLIESELFGSEKGPFTGTIATKRGAFELANGGTLFLDEVADLSLMTQAKILRVLENGEIQKEGSESPIKLDVRLISGTHKDLKAMIQKGEFRQDLVFLLKVVPINLPPLREREADIILLIHHFKDQLCQEHGLGGKDFDAMVLKRLRSYSWPGNIRELKNIIERLLIVNPDNITVDHLPKELQLTDVTPPPSSGSLKTLRDNAERQLIIKCLKQHRGNITQAAQTLELGRSYLHRRMSQLRITKRDYFF